MASILTAKNALDRRILWEIVQTDPELKSNCEIVREQKLTRLAVGESTRSAIASIYPVIADVRAQVQPLGGFPI